MNKQLIYKHDPLNGLLNEFFGGMSFTNGVSSPLVNVMETDKEFNLEVLAPGYDKKNFDIQVENGVITISNKIEEESTKSEENYTRREFYRSSFSRSFKLPKNVNTEDIKASYNDGVLILTVPKSEIVKKVKQIDIQ